MKYVVLQFASVALGLMIGLLSATSLVAQQPTDFFAPADASVPIIDGNSYLSPFSTGENRSSRFQQLNIASLFSVLPPGGGWVYAIYFRGDPFLAGNSSLITIPRVQLNLSTTTRSESELSAKFDENTGLNDKVALGPASLTFGFVGGHDGQSGFSGFNLEHPFFYNPALGNLLFDFRVYQGAPFDPLFPPGGYRFDAFDRPNDGVSSVFANGQGLPTSGAVTSLGLAMAFTVMPMPQLSASLQSSNLLLRYAYRPPGFVLQQSSLLGSGASWQPANGPATTNGAEKVVTLPFDPKTPSRFFRLVLPSSAGLAETQAAGEPAVIPNEKR